MTIESSQIEMMSVTERLQALDQLWDSLNVLVYGKPRADGMWEGWLEFVPASAELSVLRTSRETKQPDRRALEYWASGLEPLYSAGAFGRAL